MTTLFINSILLANTDNWGVWVSPINLKQWGTVIFDTLQLLYMQAEDITIQK